MYDIVCHSNLLPSTEREVSDIKCIGIIYKFDDSSGKLKRQCITRVLQKSLDVIITSGVNFQEQLETNSFNHEVLSQIFLQS